MGLLCKQAEASSLITSSPLSWHFYYFFLNSRKGSIYFRVAHAECPRSTYWTRICRMSPGSAGVQLIWRWESGWGFWKEKQVCGRVPAPLNSLFTWLMRDLQQLPTKKRVTLSPMRSYHVSGYILGRSDWTVCFQCRQDNSTASLNCSRRPAVSAFSAAAPPKLIFNVSLPLLNNEKLQWNSEWKIRQQRSVWVTRSQLHTYYHLRRLFCIQTTSS